MERAGERKHKICANLAKEIKSMAYNEDLVKRVSALLSLIKMVEEKKMFGGLTFMVNGKMCVGVSNNDLMVRLDPEVYNRFVKTPGFQTGDEDEARFQDFAVRSGEALESLKFKKTADSRSAEAYETALQKTGCKEMKFTGKPMKGFVFVSPEGTKNEKDLNYWIDLALDFNEKVRVSKKKKKR